VLFFDENKFSVLKNLGLDPEPDSAAAWIRIKQQLGSGDGFSKMSGSGLRDYGGIQYQ
jgi:hypothetical protein